MKKYNHAFTVGFSIESDNDGDDITIDELWQGLEARLSDLRANRKEIGEACGVPFDTYENDEVL
jgi:hypothetical protein